MNITILGATGTLGKSLVNALLKDTPYHLILVSRNAHNIYQDNDRQTVINADITHSNDLRKVLNKTNIVICAISGKQLPQVAQNLVQEMPSFNLSRLIFMGAVGIYNEIPDDMDGEDNLDNEPEQIPNREAVDIIEKSFLNYTILRPGYLK